ncbi:MAG: hypothetical protein AAGB93_15970 [Planctomycetota bacterium]
MPLSALSRGKAHALARLALPVALVGCSSVRSSDEATGAYSALPAPTAPVPDDGPSDAYVAAMKIIDAMDSENRATDSGEALSSSAPAADERNAAEVDSGAESGEPGDGGAMYYSDLRRPTVNAAPASNADRPWFDNMAAWTHDGTGWTRDGGATYLEDAGGSIRVAEEGALIEGLYIRGSVEIAADGVTIRNCLLDGHDAVRYGVNTVDGTHVGTRFEGCEFVRYQSAAAYGAGLALFACHIHDMHGDGLKPTEDVLVEGCFIHSLGLAEDAHADGAQFVGGGDTTFRGCHFWMPTPRSAGAPAGDYKSNAALFICTNFAPIRNVVVEGCWINGGNYTIYNVDKGRGHGSPTGTVLRFNRIGRDYQYGVLRTDAGDLTAVGNVWDDTGEPCDLPGL